MSKRTSTQFKNKAHIQNTIYEMGKSGHTGKQIQNFQVDLYNSLPVHINDLSRKEFESQLNQFLIKNAFYSIDEYREFSQLQR